MPALAVAAWLGWSAVTGGTKSASARGGYLTDTAARKPFRISVVERGEIDSLKSATIVSQVEGSNTIIFLVPEGTIVKQGDLLCELDASLVTEEVKEGVIKVTQAEAAVKKAEESLEIQKRQNESDISAAELAVDLAELDYKKFLQGDYVQQRNEMIGLIKVAEEDLTRAQQIYEYTERMARKGYKSQNELKANQIAVTKAETSKAAAEDKLRVLDDFTHERTVKELEERKEESVRNLDRTKRRAVAAMAQFEADFAAAKLTYEVESEDLTRDKAQMANCKIYAPSAGEVVYASGDSDRRSDAQPIGEGTAVRERQEIIKLPDLTRMKVDVRVHESLISRIRPGLPARIRVDALPGKTLAGRVTSVSSVPVAGSWFRPDLKEYSCVVEIDYTPGEDVHLKPGLTAEVEIVVQERDDVLQVPLLSVVSIGSTRYAYVAGRDGAKRREIVTGAENDSHIEILDGLAEGDRVVLTPRTFFAEDLAAAGAKPVGAKADGEKGDGPSADGAAGPAGGTADAAGPAAGGTAAARPQGQGGRPNPAQMFGELDANKDGSLTRDELTGRMADRFDAIDADKDGKVSRAELAEAAKNFRPPGGGSGGPGGGGAGGPGGPAPGGPPR